jgi:hypothetical protein
VCNSCQLCSYGFILAAKTHYLPETKAKPLFSIICGEEAVVTERDPMGRINGLLGIFVSNFFGRKLFEQCATSGYHCLIPREPRQCCQHLGGRAH